MCYDIDLATLTVSITFCYNSTKSPIEKPKNIPPSSEDVNVEIEKNIPADAHTENSIESRDHEIDTDDWLWRWLGGIFVSLIEYEVCGVEDCAYWLYYS